MMQNELKYQVRSREIGDLVSMLKSGRLIISPYFQRNLVWREAHKRDFIDTILSGLPFPQIFLARGPINVDTMTSYTCVVDGQQRLSAIREFASDGFAVNGRLFSQLANEEKTAFIKYEVPVIDFDLDAGDARLKDVFKRLNRTFYSLSAIERIATEYSASEFLLLARVLCGDISVGEAADEELQALDVFAEDLQPQETDAQEAANAFLRDPGISEEKWNGLLERLGGDFANLMLNQEVFSPYEYQRKVPLMFVLNVMATIMGGYFGRNSKVKEFLERYSDSFEQGDAIFQLLNSVAQTIIQLDLPEKSMWWNKANFFSMVCELAFLDEGDRGRISGHETKSALMAFEDETPRDFQIAAREAVNNRPERVLRGEHFKNLLVFVTDVY